MLVLSRKASESIQIGDDVTVEIRRIAGNRVTVAIQAPRDVRILRGELEKIRAEFEEEPATELEFTTTHQRLRMPRLHQQSAQAVG